MSIILSAAVILSAVLAWTYCDCPSCGQHVAPWARERHWDIEHADDHWPGEWRRVE